MLTLLRQSPTAMPFSGLKSFQDFLLRTKLVTPPQLQESIARVQLSGPSVDALIQELEQRHYLTPYQAGKLKKRETDGLRLGPYKLLYRNASGSFARVFRGCSVDDGRMIGIKVLRQKFANDSRAVNLFRREGELGKRLKHKNIVPIYDVGSDGNQHYIAMEFIEGGNFRELIKSRGKFSSEEATKYVLDMAEGLEYALKLGLTHRDLKLTNVLLSAQGMAKLVDFGLAGQDASLSDVDEEVDRAVEYGTLERSTNAPDNDPRSDLYFLGAIYYELLTGQGPYPPSKSREDRRQPSRYRNVRPIRQIDPSLPTSITSIVDRLMHINPHERYQSPTEVIRDLKDVVGERPEVCDESNLIPESGASGDSPNTTDSKGGSPVVLCVENRHKQQDSLREYFTKHGYRVLLLRDVDRAIGRLHTGQLHGIILMADSLGENPKEVQDAFARCAEACKVTSTPLLLVLSKHNRELKDKLETTPVAQYLAEREITLRSIRTALEKMAPKKA